MHCAVHDVVTPVTQNCVLGASALARSKIFSQLMSAAVDVQIGLREIWVESDHVPVDSIYVDDEPGLLPRLLRVQSAVASRHDCVLCLHFESFLLVCAVLRELVHQAQGKEEVGIEEHIRCVM